MKKWPLLVAAAVAACGAAQDTASGVVSDAGGWLIEAGAALQDAGEGANGSAHAQQPGTVSHGGSRIEMRVDVVDGEDGSWLAGTAYPFDTARNERCSPGIASDGKMRCIPAASLATATYFSDPACTKVLLLLFPGCKKPVYVSTAKVAAHAACASEGFRIFNPGSEYVGDLYVGSPDSCGLQGPSSEQPYAFLSLGAEVKPSDFVLLSDAGHIALK